MVVSVNVSARREPRLALKEIARRRIAASEHRPAGGDAIEGKERQAQAVRVLSAVAFLVPQQYSVAACYPVGCAVDHDVPQRESSCMGELPVVPGGDQESAGPSRHRSTGGGGHTEPQQGGQVQGVCDLP